MSIWSQGVALTDGADDASDFPVGETTDDDEPQAVRQMAAPTRLKPRLFTTLASDKKGAVDHRLACPSTAEFHLQL
jgi:hypothetical protein